MIAVAPRFGSIEYLNHEQLKDYLTENTVNGLLGVYKDAVVKGGPSYNIKVLSKGELKEALKALSESEGGAGSSLVLVSKNSDLKKVVNFFVEA
jgi:hypothetical protein